MTSSNTFGPGETMCELTASTHLASLVEENSRRNDLRFAGTEARPIKRVGIVGAGVMGSVVAASAVVHGIPVVITDQNPAALESVSAAIEAAIRPELVAPQARSNEQVTDLVSLTADLSDVAACDLIVESIVENVTTKRTFYSGLEKLCPDDTLIVSNTSTLPIAELAAHLKYPQRFCGLHFFPPIGERKMLEVIPGATTNDLTTASIVRYCQQVARIPIVVADGRGFLVNRILMSYMNAGLRLALAGVGIHAIEAAAARFEMSMGPIRLYDEVGLDVAMQCGWSFSAESETLIVRTPTIVRLMKAKHLGRKAGRGFFVHQSQDASERVGDVNPKALEVLDSQIESHVELAPDDVLAAIILPMVIEATKLLETGRAESARQVDLAIMCGIGFPASRGGPLYWADQIGAQQIVATLERLKHLGPHLAVPPLLLDAAKSNRSFYEQDSNSQDARMPAKSEAVRNGT